MGLPLFVPPVESDLARKPSKSPSRSPPRTNIRRSNDRDRPSSARTARLIEQIQSRRALPRAVSNALNSENVSTEIVSTSEHVVRQPSSDDDPDRPRPQRLIRMAQRFGSDWRERDWGSPQPDVDGELWIVEHRLWGGRARLSRLGPELSRFASRAPASTQSHNPSVVRAQRRLAATSSRVSPLSLPWSTNVVPWSPEPSRRETNDANGLGDRMRSVSPEGWDTLLSTLTPDPQPPSANSSFVSTAATQNANVSSSSTSFSEPLQPGDRTLRSTLPEPPCEPGQETSAGEDEENSSTRATNRGPTRAMNPVRFNVPDYNTEGISDASVPQGAGDSQQRPLRVLPVPRQVSVTRQERDSLVAHLSAGGWHLPTGRRPRNRETPASYANTRPAVDEEMTGWQRIVRGLAVRDDIPDEWWAEAGLSRTLTGDRP